MRYSSQSGVDHGEGARSAPALFPVALNEERGVASAFDRTIPRGSADPASALRRVTGDARLAAVFKQIRAILGVSEMEMARRLGTDLGTVLDFESGAVDALPPWPVTARLVERYAQLGGVDPAPILGRLIHLQTPVIAPAPDVARLPSSVRPVQALPVEPLPFQVSPQPFTQGHETREPSGQNARPTARAQVVQQAAPSPPEPTTEAPHLGFPSRSKLRTVTPATTERTQPPADEDSSVRDTAASKRRRRRIVRSLLVASPVLLLIGLFALLQAAPRPVYSVANALPGTLGSTARSLVDTMVLQTASFKDGLRWIETSDPRLRKGDRLAGR